MSKTMEVSYTKEELWKLLAEAWEMGYWLGNIHSGPINDAVVAEMNPYKKEQS